MLFIEFYSLIAVCESKKLLKYLRIQNENFSEMNKKYKRQGGCENSLLSYVL